MKCCVDIQLSTKVCHILKKNHFLPFPFLLFPFPFCLSFLIFSQHHSPPPSSHSILQNIYPCGIFKQFLAYFASVSYLLPHQEVLRQGWVPAAHLLLHRIQRDHLCDSTKTYEEQNCVLFLRDMTSMKGSCVQFKTNLSSPKFGITLETHKPIISPPPPLRQSLLIFFLIKDLEVLLVFSLYQELIFSYVFC